MQNECEEKIMNYIHQAQYYETDQMGIIHHSNYIRWMEEARIAYMDELGFPCHLSRVNAQKSKNIFYEARMRAISSRKSCSEHR